MFSLIFKCILTLTLQSVLIFCQPEDNNSINGILTDILDRNKLLQEHSDVFVQLGKYLFKNSSKSVGNDKPVFQNKFDRERETVNTFQDWNPVDYEVKGNKRKQVVEMPGHSAWPILKIFQANNTRHVERPAPGYRKRAGSKPVTLSISDLTRLREAVEEVGTTHRPSDYKQWETLNCYKHKRLKPTEQWHNSISQHALYRPDMPEVIDSIMDNLARGKISFVEDTGDQGTQVKFIIDLDDGSSAMVKPIRYSRDIETLPDHFYFSDHERHTAEIAAFHLDRLLNFRRVPPTTGRLLNITAELFEVGDNTINGHRFLSPAGNWCYKGGCDYYCDLHHMICGRPHLLEVSMMAFLPSRKQNKRSTYEHPWKKSYNKRHQAAFETDDTYCHTNVTRRPLYRQGRRFLDLMDTCVFDFLSGNTDRHHYNTFTRWDNNTATIHLDNGKGFGNSQEDEMINLLPIEQCCKIRFTTLRTLLTFHDGPTSLGEAMKDSMKDDVLAPVLLDPHYEALDRRTNLILKTIADCLGKGSNIKDVIIDDSF